MKPLAIEKFQDPARTARGEARAFVDFVALKTLWFNTGTLCNLTCANCYIESSPRNDRLAYTTAAEVDGYLNEIDAPTADVEIGFTGGEPFLNPEFVPMLTRALERGHPVLVLTNAMRPLQKRKNELLALNARFGKQLNLRVSIDHYSAERHEQERGPRSFKPTIDGLRWLSANGFSIAVAGRTYWGESESAMRTGFAALFAEHSIAIDAHNPHALVLFPEMDATVDTPEVSVGCWDILKKSPNQMMCASSRMVVKRRGQAPSVAACTLLPYDQMFDLGPTLRGALAARVPLNHPHCSKFCVLGGGSCSA
jgi:uncharacterized Fe-S cluster-containing radical SAM superfamily protein